MYARKQGLSAEQQHEVVGRFFSQESQVSLKSYYQVSQQRISQIIQKYNEDPNLKAKALDAASSFYEMNPDKRPNGARASTHPAAASHNCGGLTVMRAIPLPLQAPPQQFSALNPSVTVHPGILRGMSHAELNVIGDIRLLPRGQAFTAGPAWTAHPQHQRPALGYVQAGQGTPRTCTSQGPLEIHRPAAGAAQPPAGACIVEEPPGLCCVPSTCAPAGDLMPFTELVGNLRPIQRGPAQGQLDVCRKATF